jgi:hypothetical protein
VFLVVTGITIFTLTNFTRANLAELLPTTNAIFHLFAYGFFTMLWLQYIHLFLPMKALKPKWMIAALALPIGFLLTVKLFSVVFGKDVAVQDVITATAGIVIVVATTSLITLFRRGITEDS